MSVDANALERETLERKDRDELQKIAGALGGKVTSRTRKADIIDMILELTGVTSASSEQADAADTATESSQQQDEKSEREPDDKPAQKNGTSSDSGQKSERSNPSGQRSVSAQRSASAQRNESGSKDTEQASQGQRGQGQRGQDSNEQSSRNESGGKGQGQRNESSGGGSNRTDDSKQGGSAVRSDDNDNDGGSDDDGEGGGRRRRRRGRNRDTGQQEEYTGEPIPVVGCLDLRDDGYGFLRVDGMLPSKDDCYVSVKQVRQFGLRKGDVVAGGSRPAFRNEKNPAILRIDTVNDVPLEPGTERPLFEELTATFATEALDLKVEASDDADGRVARAIDLLAPIGKGSRVLLGAPPRTGKTSILQTIARAVEANEPDAKLVVVLLDERPEEITEMADVVAAGSVHGSPFDANPDEHVAMLDLALARCRRMAEAGDDVVVLVDGLTRLARAEHASGQTTGRTVGGLEAGAIQAAKRAFGTGRKLADAGSVTIVATATVDTDSSVDEAVFDAVVGAATTQIRLDRFAAERRSFPALDVGRTSTRREELLVGDEGAAQREALRRVLAGLPDPESADQADGLDGLLDRLRNTKSNEELLQAAVKEDA